MVDRGLMFLRFLKKYLEPRNRMLMAYLSNRETCVDLKVQCYNKMEFQVHR